MSNTAIIFGGRAPEISQLINNIGSRFTRLVLANEFKEEIVTDPHFIVEKVFLVDDVDLSPEQLCRIYGTDCCFNLGHSNYL